jgi:hypothetical protein
MAYLYTHTRLDNNSIFYVGIGSDTKGKYKRAYAKTRGTHWNRIVKKYGYSVSIIKDNLTWEEACDEEILLIKKYGRLDLEQGLLINKTNGGEGFYGGIHSDKSKQKLKEAWKHRGPVSEETKLKISKGRKGFIHTDEAKLKISKAHSGRVHNDDYKEACRQRRIGKKLSEDTIEKLKNIVFTEERRKKLSEAHKNSYKNGRVSATKGKSPSEETKLKLSLATKLYWENKKKKAC